ncbi:MAG: hypothetical protein HQ546_11665 [Planctomycetes bacterium]|nr:hypothetical protein [Planctomycetota bacterium]
MKKAFYIVVLGIAATWGYVQYGDQVRAWVGQAADGPANTTSIKGTCTWGGKKSTWSADLTARGNGAYDAVYVSSWGGKPLNYVGTIKTDLRTEISGNGKASGGRANGAFEFSGKYGADGIARCSYKEVGGRRSGSLTAERPK